MLKPENRSWKSKIWYTGLLFLVSFQVFSQDSFLQDTIKIGDVIITGKRTEELLTGFKTISIDSAILSGYTDESLSDLLADNSGFFVKSYGMGGSATPSFRGTGASHTQIQWNNININNPMLGQSDLSILPAALIDGVEIYYGGSSNSKGTGGIGGIINLENKPVWRSGSIISLSPNVGSFGHYSGLIKVKTGNLRFQSSTKAYLGYSKNDFDYLNDLQSEVPVREKMKNNESVQKGLMQEIYFRKSRDILSARIWYQFADRNLPSSMLIPQESSTENQIDESLRAMLNYDGYSGFSEYFVTGAFSTSKLNYTNQLASIYSLNRSESFTLKAGLKNRVGVYVLTRVIIENENVQVKTENYSDNKAGKNVSTLTAIAEVNSEGRVGATFLVKEILHGKSFLLPDFSTGLQFKISNDADYYLKANFSKNSKLPSMNDLFWLPGGNPDLQQENAFTYELIYEMAQKISFQLNTKVDITAYHNSISNMIQWRPGIYSYWIADNVKNVNTSGIESSASFDYKQRDFTSSLKISYTFTNAKTTGSEILNDESLGRQLIYVPVHQLNTYLRVVYKDIFTDWKSGFTGKRFTTTDNSSSLPGYFLNSFSTGYMLQSKTNLLSLGITVDNLFNASYQAIAYYPQPGRSYLIKLLIQFTK